MKKIMTWTILSIVLIAQLSWAGTNRTELIDIISPNSTSAVQIVGDFNLPGLTVSQPGYIDASGDLVSQDLSLTADVTGVLPTANGGTGSNSTATFPASGTLVTRDAAETLTNKTIDGDDNTLQDIGYASLANGTDGELITWDASGAPAVVPVGTATHVLTSNGVGAAPTFQAAAGGGGTGGLDTVANDDFETTGATDFNTGNNATPDGAGTGTLSGTWTDEILAPIASATSLKYVMGAASTNDFVIIGADLTVDAATGEKLGGNWVGITFYYNYNGDDDDIRFILLDNADNELTSSIEYLKTNSLATRFSTAVYIPEGVTGIRYGFQTVTGNNTKIMRFDDLEISTNPFVYKDLVDTHVYSISQAGNALTNSAAEIEFALGSATITDNGVGLITATDDSGNTRTKFISNKNGVSVKISFSQVIITANQTAEIYKNGTSIILGSQVGANTRSMSSAVITLDKDEYFTVGSSGNAYIGADPSYLSFEATSTTEHVVTPATGTLTNWASYTPTTQGIGTPTINVAKWRQVGENYEIIIEGTAGTTTAAELQIGLPNSKTVSGVGTNVLVGQGGRDIASTAISDLSVLATDGDAFVNLSVFNNSGAGSLTPQNGSTLLSGTDGFSLQFSVKVNGLTANATFLAAIPIGQIQKVNLSNAAGKGSTNTLNPYYSSEDLYDGGGLFTYATDSTNGTIATASKKIFFTWKVYSSSSSSWAAYCVRNSSDETLFLSGEDKAKLVGQGDGSGSAFSVSQCSTIMTKGDTISFRQSGTISTGADWRSTMEAYSLE